MATRSTSFRRAAPVLRAAWDRTCVAEQLAAFMRQFGYGFDGADVSGAASQLGPLVTSVLQLGSTTRAAIADGIDAADLITIADAAQPLFEGLGSFHQALSSLPLLPGLSAQDFPSLWPNCPKRCSTSC